MNKYLKSGFLFFLLLSSSCFLYGQDTSIPDQQSHGGKSGPLLVKPGEGSIEEYVQWHQAIAGEKIFLHTDRSDYFQGDTIWFKSYLWFGYDQIPDTTSGILHVDLISTKGKALMESKLLIQNGTAYGEFATDSIIIPGKYFLRAYTRRMQNPDCGEPFYKELTVNKVRENFQFECNPAIIRKTNNDSIRIVIKFLETDPNGSINENDNHLIKYSLRIGDKVLTDSILAKNSTNHVLQYNLNGIPGKDSIGDISFTVNDSHLKYEKNFKIPLGENIDLQFFPEGGNLVGGLENKVAFKAIGIDGLSREVKGEILSSGEKVVASFRSIHRGMGFFKFRPESEKQYSASFWYKNQKYIVPLPKVSDEGIVMSLRMDEFGYDPLLSICRTGDRTPKYVTGSSYGKIWFSAVIGEFRDSCLFEVPVEMLPEGVCRLTVLNQKFEPQCERLLYVNNNQRVNIDVLPDSSSYSTRSKVSLLIYITNQGVPVQADVSLAVVDKEQTAANSTPHGIISYKLLESELKGTIEDPDSYFKTDSCQNLDLLMLTHGYRKFLNENASAELTKYQPEKNFFVSGEVTFGKNKSLEKNFSYHDLNLSLISITQNPYLAQSHPDSGGRFLIPIPLLTGNPRMMIQATNPKRHRFKGDITLDKPLVETPLFKIPPADNKYTLSHIEFISRNQQEKKADTKNYLPGSMSKTLGEVVVTAKANSKNWWTNFDQEATKVADLDSLDPEGNKYKDLPELLHNVFGATVYEYADFRTALLPSNNPYGPSMIIPVYLINGTVFSGVPEGEQLYMLESFPVDEIKKISVLPPGKEITMHYQPLDYLAAGVCASVVVIETYTKDTFRGDIEGVKKFILDGLDAPRSFYSPRYEGSLKNRPGYDNRSILFWAPSLRTDMSGEVKIDFYTGDRKTDFDIIVNGMDIGNGYPGQAEGRIVMNK